ncbi:N-carbamoylputrescine amidase [Cyclonatronum proteinivorum]|uniref:N-carbamoylputrescine amidase n=1 Tax=Cyclonatronum proteinivorum TaxID=1457365 RepID=A0A345ULL1_9BACT|nr:carbon-nitrogen hydrolase [Cyclonatronum proteinivorum]AXJ01363.1 N-carbamoylputrescine amidase [Cyclonatronum proteinivorum]
MKASDKVVLGLIQTSSEQHHQPNVDKTFAHIREAASRGAQIICTQELYTSDYFCQNHDEAHFDLAVEIPGELTTETAKLAESLGVVIISSIFEKRAPGVYHNTATVHDADGSLLGIYRKMHIPEDPGFHEKFYFTPGDTGFKAFDTRFGRIGVLICWDQWFPEAARLTAMQGAEILFYPTAIGVLPEEPETLKREFMDAWEIMHRSHAVANGCYVAAINRVGQEGDIRFWGDSFVSGPFGQILAQAGETPEILIAECDLSLIEKQRRTWPFLRDRRIDAYQGLLKRHGR